MLDFDSRVALVRLVIEELFVFVRGDRKEGLTAACWATGALPWRLLGSAEKGNPKSPCMIDWSRVSETPISKKNLYLKPRFPKWFPSIYFGVLWSSARVWDCKMVAKGR